MTNSPEAGNMNPEAGITTPRDIVSALSLEHGETMRVGQIMTHTPRPTGDNIGDWATVIDINPKKGTDRKPTRFLITHTLVIEAWKSALAQQADSRVNGRDAKAKIFGNVIDRLQMIAEKAERTFGRN